VLILVRRYTSCRAPGGRKDSFLLGFRRGVEKKLMWLCRWERGRRLAVAMGLRRRLLITAI